MKTFITTVLLVLSFPIHSQDWDSETYNEAFPITFENASAPIQIVNPPPKPKVIKVVPRAQLLAQQRIKQIQREKDDSEEQEADDVDVGYDELSIHRGYSRPRLVEDDDTELSDEIKIRLMVARMKALEVYRTKWA
jgi:hypothetical protein